MGEKVEVSFYLLDIVFKQKENRPALCLYGKTSSGKKICIVEENFLPYFYAEPIEIEDRERLKKELLALKVPFKEGDAVIHSVEEIEKKLLGSKKSLLKIFALAPSYIPFLKRELDAHPKIKKCYEFDISFIYRYLIDKNILPLALLHATGEWIPEKSKVPVFLAKSITPTEETTSDLQIMAFDIETYSKTKVFQPEKNPILMIALYGKDFRKVLTWKKYSTQLDYVEFAENEKEMLIRFKDLLKEHLPDLLIGYHSDGFDFPYIKTRAEIHNVDMDLGLDYSDLTIGRSSSSACIAGLPHIDLLRFIRHNLRTLETETFTLNAVASEILGEKKKEVDIDALSLVWDGEAEKLDQYCEYNLHDAHLTYQLAQRILPHMIELSGLVGLPLFDINRVSSSRLVENFIMRRMGQFKELIPAKPSYHENQERRSLTYEGAYVHEPKPGFYRNVAVFDFRSLYPTIITANNISPYTLHCCCCKDKGLVPDAQYWFCREKDGILPSLLEELILRRIRVKEMLKSDKNNLLLQARSESIKLLSNSFYGYLAFFGARWYSLESALSITSYGRHYISQVIAKAQEAGFDIIYADTDSVFINLNERKTEDASEFVQEINKKLPGFMELDYEDTYKTGIFVAVKKGHAGAKKKYALFSESRNKLKIRGFETIRKNWSKLAKEVQQKVLEILLKEENKEKAFDYVRKIIFDIQTKKIPLKKMIISTHIQKSIESYEAVGPHVAVARRMQEKGIPMGPGSIVKFIITSGEGMLRNRARPPEEVKEGDYDAEYYINNQIVPAVNSILSVVGYTEEDLLKSNEQSDLSKFF